MAVFLMALGLARPASARTCIWSANSNAFFSTSGAWKCDGISGSTIASGDAAQFDSTSIKTCAITANTTMAQLTIASSYTGTVSTNATYTIVVNGAVSVAGGTLNLAGSGITSTLQATSFAQTGGTVSLASDATISGAFTNSGGTLSITGGTLTLTGSGSLSPGGSSLNNLTINASGLTYTLGSSLVVGGNLTVTAGTLAAGANAITVAGNWSNSGTVTTTGTVTLNGTSASGMITSGGSSFAALTLNGSGGTYTLQDALVTTGALTLTAGTLSTGSNTVTIGGDLTSTGGSYTGGAGSATVAGNVNMSNNSGSDPTLVGYWKLDETASPSADSSGNGNSLTWNASPTTTTDHPSAITFTDTHSLAQTGSAANNNNNSYAGSAVLSGISVLRPTTVTLSAWYKATSVDTNGSDVVSGSNTYGLRITTTGLTVMKRITDNTGAADWIEYRVAVSNILDGAWHQIVGVITTGTGGGMTAYFDGAAVSGNYWVNGTSGASQLNGSSTPTASAAATDAIDWDANTETYGLIVGNNPSTTGYHFGAGCSGTSCAIDDVRVYNRALGSTDVATLAHGSVPTGIGGVLSLSGAMSVTGSVTVQSAATVTLASGTLKIGTALTMDGTLNSTGGTIQAVSGTYTFKIGSTATATPTLNINGLTVKNTDANGMWINANTSAVTTFTEFDKIGFSSGTGGAGTALLNINASTLYLSSNGCTFDGSTTYAVKLTAVGSSNPRALFGYAKCATNDASTGLCPTSAKKDDDSDNDGIPDAGNGAVVQFIHAAESDTYGTKVGFPTAAFDWNSFAYYSTYVTFHGASGNSDVIYVRDENGDPLYSWTDPNSIAGTNETIVGTPQWITSGGTHYLYVAVNGTASNTGGIYRLKDTGTKNTSGTLTLDTTWPTTGTTANTGHYNCTCTITSDASLDATNIYWAATNAGGQKLFGLIQASGAAISGSWPIAGPATVTTSAPTLVVSGTTSLFLGATSTLAELNFGTLAWMQDVPTGIGTITGRVSYGTSALAATSGTSRIYAGDASGTVWAISPSSFTTGTVTTFLWKYAAGSAVTDNYYDAGTDTVMFGTSGGAVVALTGAGSGSSGALVNSSYPYTLPNSDVVSTAPLYYGGVLVVGSTKGNLYFLDRNTGNGTAPNGVKILKEVNFGSTESVSTIGFDAAVSRFMVSTSSSASDGRLYYFDLVTDPTSSTQ